MNSNQVKHCYDNNSDGVLKCGYNRNSFDRFGDDLCEQVLQYLSFEDKIRFECVSKQWKCCVYQRQYILQTIDPKYDKTVDSLSVYKLYETQANDTELGVNRRRITKLEQILRKCRKINRINIDDSDYTAMHFNDIIRIITNNCERIISIKLLLPIHYYFNEFKHEYENRVKDLLSKYGNTLQTIDFFRFSYKHLLELCSNIVSINNIKLNELIDATNDVILAPKLSVIKNLEVSADYELMNRFVDRYCHTIRVFDAQIGRHVNYLDFMSQLSQLKNLENLSLTLGTVDSTSDIVNGFENFAKIRGNRVKHLCLQFRSGFDETDTTRLLALINNNFAEIKSLRINGVFFNRYHTYRQISLELNKSNEIRIRGGYMLNDLMYRFLTQYRNNIKAIDAEYRAPIDYTNFMSHLSPLNKLNRLSLCISLSGSSNFYESFKNYSESGGKQIKHLSLEFKRYSRCRLNKTELLTIVRIINNFTEIQSLRISGPYDERQNIGSLTFESIRNCKQLTRLEFEEFIDDNCFVDIDKYLPQLTVIDIKSNYYNTITDRMLNSLAKLIHLKELHVIRSRFDRSNTFSHKAISNLLESCEHFQSLNIDKCPLILSETILKFVEIAKIRAHINFDHRFNCTSEQTLLFKSTIKQISDGLPHNLKITYE